MSSNITRVAIAELLGEEAVCDSSHSSQTSHVRNTEDDDADFAPTVPEDADFPRPLEPKALHGLAGEAVKLIAPQSEAHPAAILGQFLVIVGAMAGRTRFMNVGRGRHYPNEYIAIVSPTGESKGISAADADAVLQLACPDFYLRHVGGGISSGEGLMSKLRDADGSGGEPHPNAVPEEGCYGKRWLHREEEGSILFKVRDRQGNTVTEILRKLYDGKTIETIVRKGPLRASNVHLSLVLHITPADLREGTQQVEMKNGLMNRIMFIAARRTQLLPNGGHVAQDDIARLAREIAQVLPGPSNRFAMERDAAAEALWEDLYRDLVIVGRGPLAAAAARGRVHVNRLSMIYAILDGEVTIRRHHIEAAAALWRYGRASLRYAFGSSPLSSDAERVLGALVAAPEHRLSWTELSVTVLGRHWDKRRIDKAVEELLRGNRVRVEVAERTGRSRRTLVLESANSANNAKFANNGQRPGEAAP